MLSLRFVVALLFVCFASVQAESQTPAWLHPGPPAPIAYGLSYHHYWTEGDNIELVLAATSENLSIAIQQSGGSSFQMLPMASNWTVSAGIMRGMWKVDLSGNYGSPYFNLDQGSNWFSLLVIDAESDERIKSDDVCIRSAAELAKTGSASSPVYTTAAVNAAPSAASLSSAQIAAIVLGVFLAMSVGLHVLTCVIFAQNRSQRQVVNQICESDDELDGSSIWTCEKQPIIQGARLEETQTFESDR